jgi:hypothetical protein
MDFRLAFRRSLTIALLAAFFISTGSTPARAAGIGDYVAPFQSWATAFENVFAQLVALVEPHHIVTVEISPATMAKWHASGKTESAAAFNSVVAASPPAVSPTIVHIDTSPKASTPAPHTIVTASSISPTPVATLAGIVLGTTTDSVVTQSQLEAAIQQASDQLRQLIYANAGTIGQGQYSTGGYINNLALSQRIDSLSNVTIANPTVTGTVSGLTAASIPALSSLNGLLGIAQGGTGTSTQPTANRLLLSDANGNWEYFSTSTLGIISGVSSVSNADGTLTITPTNGNVVASLNLANANTWSGTQTLANLVAANATTTNLTATNLIATNATMTNATATNLAIASAGANMLLSTNGQQGVVSTSTPTAASYIATSTTASQLPYASSTAITVSGTASTSNLTVSNNFTLSNLTGFLKAVAGTVSTALINLASDVTGILPVANGGTGWASVANGAIPYGNGSSALATTSAGTAGNVLAYLNGVPTWTPTTTLGTISGTLGVGSGGTGATTLTGLLQGNGSAALTAVGGTAGQVPYFNGTNALLATSSLFLASSGNVGIGTTVPTTPLAVVGGIRLGDSATIAGTANALTVRRAGADSATYATLINEGAVAQTIASGGSGHRNDLVFSNDNSGNYIFNTGNVGIGTTNPGVRLDVSGSQSSGFVARFTNTANSGGPSGIIVAAGVDGTNSGAALIQFTSPNGTAIGSVSQTGASSVGYNTTSDRRLKENIAPTTAGLDTLLKLPVRNFDFINDPTHATTTGFIAQELYQVFPEAVTTNGDNGIVPLGATSTPWSVDYGRITPLIVKAVQDIANLSDTFKATLIAWLGNASDGIVDLFASNGHFSNELCVGSTCVTPAQFQAMVAAATVSQGEATSSSTPSVQVSAPTPPTILGTTTPPSIDIQGSNPATIHVGDTYTDLGAIVSDNQGHDLGYKTFLDGALVSNILIDTSASATDTIDYVATDTWGNTATSTRTVIINANPNVATTSPSNAGVIATSTPTAQ